MLGAGTQSNPYIVQTPQDLHNVRNNLTAYYELGNDIDMGSWGNFTPIGTSSAKFIGSFNGKGYKIKNLTINSTTAYVGLFGFTENATIQNLVIENANVVGQNVNYVGILVGNITNSTIKNCYTTGQVNGQYGVGGLVGWHYSGLIENCFSHANATGKGRVGGLVGNGATSNSLVNKCYSTGLVTVTPDPNLYNGGLVGSHADSTKVTNSYWDINTSGQTKSAGGIGKTTTEMKTQSTYAGWDFISVWGINNDYPYLQMFGVPTAPPKKETISIQSYVNHIHSIVIKTNKSTKQIKSFLNTIQTLSERHTGTKRTVSTYTLSIETSVQKSNRSVRSAIATVNTYINPIGSLVERKTKTMKRLLSYVDSIHSHVNVIVPIQNKIINAYLSVLENPSSLYCIEHNSNIYAIENPSTVEVI
ncbi:GLUG motif-containing protein [Thermaerobacillus caldiproteolyticus]|uniref:GLUG motif-containing protein n=1 Tax=Thermaerobacillus caldiproteolyticus TaxID=247480 RepID=UPI00188AF6EA|nr:GLUG motif-containing protein [Anoxybacillus caldiproteolyticus]QPA31415.1 peptidase M26 [Anoxybacillus caldiproteolyticus]